jgi:integrase/recombinase XerD
MATLGDTLREYRVCSKAEGKSSKTIRSTTQAVGYFADFLGDVNEVSKVGAKDLRAFITALREKKRWSNHPTNRSDRLLSPFSIASYVRSIRAFWSWLERERYIWENPLRKVRVPKCPERIVPAVSPKELALIIRQIDASRTAGYRDYCVLLTLVDTGVRISELTQLKLEDVHLEENCIKVVGKGGRERIVPIGNRVSRVLAKWLVKYRPDNHDGFLFTTVDGSRLMPERIEHALARYSIQALGTRVHPHQLRHTSAVEWLRGKGDPIYLQRLLGHRQLPTTRIYVNLVDDDIRLAHRKHGVIDRLRL